MNFRLGARVRAWIALAAFLCAFGLPTIAAEHRTAADDAECNAAVGAQSGNPDARILAGEGKPLSHCLLCHFQRTVGGASTSGLTRVTAPAGPAEEFPPSIDHHAAAALNLRASRGPPVSL